MFHAAILFLTLNALVSNYGMKSIRIDLNNSQLPVYEELAANHVDPMECYSQGYGKKGECFHNMTKEFMFKKGAVVFLVFVINLKNLMEYAVRYTGKLFIWGDKLLYSYIPKIKI